MGVDINWGLGQGNNALQMFQQGAQMGNQLAQRREQADYRKQQGERQDAAFAAQQEDRAAKQQEDSRGQIVKMGKLLAHAKDPVTYAQSRAAAQQLGFDISAIPEQFDPNWVAQQQMIVQAYQDGGAEKMSATAQELVDAGYQPGTPEFNTQMRNRISAQDSKPFNVGPGEGRYDIDPATGQPRTIIAPYGAAPPSAGSSDDDEWEVVPGNGTGGFPG